MIRGMQNAVAQYRAASEAGDIDALMETLSAEPEVVSPISGRMVFKGREDVRVLLSAVYASLSDLRWTREVGEERLRIVVGQARVAGVGMTDAMVFDLDREGRIQRISPHLRPWLALTLFAAILGPKIARHPMILRRALTTRR